MQRGLDRVSAAGLLNDQVLATFNQVNSQSLLCDLLAWTDITERGERLYVDTHNIAPLAYLHRYEEAIKFCDAIIEQHRSALEQKETYLSPERLRASRIASERTLKPYRELKELMLQDDHDGIMRILEGKPGRKYQRYAGAFSKNEKRKRNLVINMHQSSGAAGLIHLWHPAVACQCSSWR